MNWERIRDILAECFAAVGLAVLYIIPAIAIVNWVQSATGGTVGAHLLGGCWLLFSSVCVACVVDESADDRISTIILATLLSIGAPSVVILIFWPLTNLQTAHLIVLIGALVIAVAHLLIYLFNRYSEFDGITRSVAAVADHFLSKQKSWEISQLHEHIDRQLDRKLQRLPDLLKELNELREENTQLRAELPRQVRKVRVRKKS